MHTELDIINDMLAARGIAGLTAENTSHPYYVQAKKKLDRVNKQVQALKHWYNTSVMTLTHNPDTGEVVLPKGWLVCDPTDTTSKYVARGTRLFDSANQTYNIGAAVQVKLTLRLPIEDMDPAANEYLRARAVRDYAVQSGVTQVKLNEFKSDVGEAWRILSARHLLNKDVNIFRSAGNTVVHMKRSMGPRRSGIVLPE